MGVLVSYAELAGRYPRVSLDGFVPTHRVTLFDARSGQVLNEDLVQLASPDGNGVCLGFVPGADEPKYAMLSTGLWQCLDRHGRVRVASIRYVPDYVAPRDRDGEVYFVQRGNEGPIKIGWSQDVARRLCELQVANAEKLRLLGTISGTMADESAMHARFSHLHVNAEWFRSTGEIMAFLRSLGGEVPITLR